ncbi:pregnancy zone protein-like, partial [Uloborus diversus]|uniref:pregnancy zone protein-like n=1 Tax=Uloborus diversus TaxID=327109 RepID=UPI002408F2C6
IKLSMEPSKDYKILTESRFHKICVCAGESISTRFHLRPVSLGQLNITVYGYSMEEDDEVCGNEITARLSARDAATKQLLVEAEGFPKEEVFNYYICPEDTNGTYASEVDLLLPENVVDGSARAFMSISGDIMGPALNGLKYLVRLPVGCGEQNMVLFVPNIFVLDYLSSVGKISEEIKQECLNNMRKGYQRELQYRHGDGSYSAFGKNDIEGSLWLTAFVVRSFGQARRFIDIDEHDLRLSTAWILEKQFENGCFESTGYLHQKSLKGGLNEGEQSLALLTAYVLISILESGAVKPNQISIKNALKCLEAESNPNSYGLALFSYAAALSGEISSAEAHLKLLEEKSVRKGSLMFWDSCKSKSVSIEIAGYYILSKLAVSKNSTDNIAQIQPVVRWITRQRNTNGGFVSTQDTVVALQALSTFASRQSQKAVEIGVAIESNELVQGFKVEEDNKLVTQSTKIPVLPTGVDLQAVGEGCILVQYNLRYNVKKVSGKEAFDLNIDVLRLESINCNTPRIGICMRYKILDETSNMVVVSVKMASGFSPDESSLQNLVSDPTVQLKRHEIDGNEVNLYFDELTNEQKCLHFFIQSEVEVEDIQPASIHLYDYYEPDMKVIKEYMIPSTCSAETIPELPLLPPIVIDTVDNGGLYTFEDESMTVSSETITELPELSTIENVTLDYFPELNISTEQTTEFGNGSQFSDSLDVVELSDDASVFDDAANSSNLDNFIDVSYDLDFPDGIEGNMPVSVLPTDETTESIIATTYEEDCPVCEEYFPENFSDVYCSSAFALRVMVKNDLGVVKILHDVSADVPQPKVIRKFATLEYNSRCFCPQVHEKGKVLLVIGTPITLWNAEKDKHQLQLNNKVFIIPSSKAVQPTELRKAKNQCNNDP